MTALPSSHFKLLDLPNELQVEICKQSDNPHLPSLCSDLRDVLYSTPSFWSSIYIGEKQCTPEATSFLNKRLERCMACPLNVVIRINYREPLNTLALELWRKLSIQRDRIRTLEIDTDEVILCGTILHTVLLTPPVPSNSTLPSLRKLNIRHSRTTVLGSYHDSIIPRLLLHPIPGLFPALTTLNLPLLSLSIPYPSSPISSLKTLVLEGVLSWHINTDASFYQIAQLLAQTPNLETFWYKVQNPHSPINLSNLSILPVDDLGTQPVTLPILLPRLTKMAVVVPGRGTDLLHIIEAPALHDLHMDGTMADMEFYESVWLNWYAEQLHAGLQTTSSRSPALRRLSLVRAYLPRHTWKWLLGCEETQDVPFPLLESIAARDMEAVNGEVTNTIDNLLLELYVKQGRILLRRFAYLASEPLLRGVILRQLINSVVGKQAPDQIFELELDGVFGDDTTTERFDSMLPKGVKLIFHEERQPYQRKDWWNKEIDETESDSY